DFPAQSGPFPDILVTQEYPVDQPNILNNIIADIGVNSGLYTIQWNGNSFVSVQLPRTSGPTYSQWEHVTFAPAPSISIQKIPDGNSFNVGDNIFFTVTVTSGGPGTASNVVVTDPLPTPGNLTNWVVDSVSSTGLVFPSPTNATCTVAGGNQLTCNFGSMAAGATATVKGRTTTAD